MNNWAKDLMSKKRIMKKGKLTICHPDAAGIDVGSEKHYVAIPDDDRSHEPVRSFNSFTNDLHQLAQWLISCGIDTVAMESTGIYWIQLYLILESYGLKVYLVNAQHVKNVPGRKSDVADCQWIQELHTYGLLKASFQPDDLTRELRTYLRHRKSLTQGYSKQVLLMQKAFEQINIKLHDVIADITGKTGQQIIQAILSGNRKPESLVTFVDHRVKASKEDIIKSLTGIWLEEHLFELRQAYELYHVYKDKINDCDLQIENSLKKMELEQQTGKPNEKNKYNTKKTLPIKTVSRFLQTTIWIKY